MFYKSKLSLTSDISFSKRNFISLGVQVVTPPEVWVTRWSATANFLPGLPVEFPRLGVADHNYGWPPHPVQKLTEKMRRTAMSCEKQKATPNLKDAKAETMVALPSRMR